MTCIHVGGGTNSTASIRSALAALLLLAVGVGGPSYRAAGSESPSAAGPPPDIDPRVMAARNQPSPVQPTWAAVAYAPPDPREGRGHLLDIYLPRDRSARMPVVIWTGGSAWRAENGRDTAGWIAKELNPAGYAVVGVSVRSSTNARFPAQLNDMKAAIRWLRANARRYGLDADRLAIMGDSSGGWNAALTALTPDVPDLQGSVGITGPSSAVRAAIAYYPPTDFLLMDEHMLGDCAHGNSAANPKCHDSADSPESRLVGCPVQSCPKTVERANPARYVSGSTPPILILHGEEDRLVPYHQGELLYQALSRACRDATLIDFPHAGHGTFTQMETDDATRVGATTRSTGTDCRKTDPAPLQPTWQTIIDFLDRTTKP